MTAQLTCHASEDRTWFAQGAKRLAVRAKREELDMFDDEAPDDLFAATPDDKKADKGRARRGLVDAYDDIEGYYNFQVRTGVACGASVWKKR